MTFVNIQRSQNGEVQRDNFSAAQTFNAWTGSGAGNFTVGNLVTFKCSHYAPSGGDSLTCTINGTTANKLERSNSPNVVNAAILFWLLVTTGGSRNVVATPTAGTGHYLSGEIAEYSFNGTCTLVGGAATGADGTFTSPSTTPPTANTDAATAVGNLIESLLVVADSAVRTITAPSGYTAGFNEGDSANKQGGGGAWRIAAAGGAQATGWTMSTSGVWTVMNAVFADSGGAAPAGGPVRGPTQQLLSGALPHLRMSPRSDHDAQQLLRRQRRAYGFAASL
jgi:hypothetical protein